jgi:CSLREA domain-containing protein
MCRPSTRGVAHFASLFLVVAKLATTPLAAATITVTSTADVTANDGLCTMREAIVAANAHVPSGLLPGECAAGSAGLDTIAFLIPGAGVQTISLATNLSSIVEPLTIDGYTQPLAAANTFPMGNNATILIALSGSGATEGLRFESGSGGSTVRGLVIGSFSGSGIVIHSDANRIVGNFIGIAANGTADIGNGDGVLINANSNAIGSSAPADRNVISGNHNGIRVQMTQGTIDYNIISGNYIGTNASGTAVVANDAIGIVGAGHGLAIGGTNGSDPSSGCRGPCNLISGNLGGGISIFTVAGSISIGIAGNFIGTTVDGNSALGNGRAGIVIGPNVTALIGGNSSGLQNVISGQAGDGIRITSDGTAPTPVTIRRNYIGMNGRGNAPLGNNGSGIVLSGTHDVVIGGIADWHDGNYISANGLDGISLIGSSHTTIHGNHVGGLFPPGNEPAGNGGAGIRLETSSNNLIGSPVPVDSPVSVRYTIPDANSIGNNGFTIASAGIVIVSGTGNRVSANTLYHNQLGAIDLGNDGPTGNDSCDGDDGPNTLLNHPDITWAEAFGDLGRVTVRGTLNAAPGSGPYDVEIFRNSRNPAESHGASSYAGFATFMLSGCAGEFVADFDPGVILAGDALTAIAIDRSTGNTSETSDTVNARMRTTATLTATPNPSTAGATIAFKVTMSPTNASGSVTLKEGDKVIGSKVLNFINGVPDGFATINVSGLGQGPHLFVAEYSGDWRYFPSVSNTVQQVVTAPQRADLIRSDLNGDARSDIVLQQTGSESSIAVWLMSDTTVVEGKIIATPQPEWRVVATGDLDGNFRHDLILRNSSTGALALWRMDGTTLLNGNVIATPGTDWRVVAVRDFTHDGRGDLVLQNDLTGAVELWEMNAATIVGAHPLGNPGADVRAIAVGSFGGDAIVLQNVTTRTISRWIVTGNSVTSDQTITTPAANWKLITAGDFDSDGRGDLALQNDATRSVAVWLLDDAGTAIVTGAVVATPVAGWKVVGSADYDGNAHSDLLLWNESANAIAQWQMNGVVIAKGWNITTAGNWKPLGN